jgi:hypothetical protein
VYFAHEQLLGRKNAHLRDLARPTVGPDARPTEPGPGAGEWQRVTENGNYGAYFNVVQSISIVAKVMITVIKVTHLVSVNILRFICICC